MLLLLSDSNGILDYCGTTRRGREQVVPDVSKRHVTYVPVSDFEKK
jgi:hypothetical protein